jgi:hypothetical protein
VLNFVPVIRTNNMDLQEFLDSIPLLVYLLFAIIILILPIEIGFRGGKQNRGKPEFFNTIGRVPPVALKQA